MVSYWHNISRTQGFAKRDGRGPQEEHAGERQPERFYPNSPEPECLGEFWVRVDGIAVSEGLPPGFGTRWRLGIPGPQVRGTGGT